jgi:hypothetical protein
MNVGAGAAIPKVSHDIRPDVDLVSDLRLSCSFVEATRSAAVLAMNYYSDVVGR